jgi:hypothetical protein
MTGKVNIDFSIHSSVYFIGVCDLSEWGLIVNEPAIIEITLPGYSRCITKYFDKNLVNVFNSKTLEINCVDDCGESENLSLPDGVYKFKVIGSPSKFNKTHYYLKTDSLQMDIDTLYIDNFESRNKTDFINKLTEIEFLLKSAESHLRKDLVNDAGQIYQVVKDMVEDLKNCKTCK